ncbi:chaperonin 10-like protein [Catenaria anguillulae PL171]|uniref:Chaperonin 10-like protein n=1 Tax=Catenaria anguillulae PL171 TaxID=765915 RepID=A0A1Y2I3Z3_9FUNG|nr:chaperonin 10-like protein [Catenaria anguillulae PL171]
MLAAFMKRYGRDALQLDQLPIPTTESLQAGEVLIRVHAVSLQPADYKTRDGSVQSLRGTPTESSPRGIGYDFSGTILELSPNGGTNAFKVGDAVFGISTYGALSTHTIAHVDHLAKKPDNVSFPHAAAIVTAGLTAWQTFEYAKAKAGTVDKVFITAGAGGVGHIAIQLAKNVFDVKTVATTASAAKHDLVRNCGADVIVDYQKKGNDGDFVKVLGAKAYDLALESTGEKGKCKQVVRPGGAVVSLLGIPDGDMLCKVVHAYHMPDSARPPGFVYGLLNCVAWVGDAGHLAKLGECVSNGKVKVTIDRVYPLEQVMDAFLVECMKGACAEVDQVNPLRT